MPVTFNEYCLIVNGTPQHTRLSVRKTGDMRHLIFGVENIEDEIQREREHMRALNTEKELARRYELTGIKNKTAYSELEKSVQRNIDDGVDDRSFALAVCDINDLKKINDSLGHKAGDEYIKSSAKLLCDIFVHSPVFRIGGDEFIIFLRGDDYSSREELIDRFHKTIMTNIRKAEGPVIAFGIAEYRPGEDLSVTEIFERADDMMYADKRGLKQQAV